MKILVIAAHPDDEVLGCGGTLYKLSRKKENKISIGFAADGVLGRHKEKTEFNDLPDNILAEIEERKKSAKNVKHLLGADILNISAQNFIFKFKDQRLDGYHLKEIADWIEGCVKKVKPDIIYTHFTGDLNLDHRLVGEATMVAARPKEDCIEAIYAYEISESTLQGEKVTGQPFLPNVFEKISLKDKLKLFEHYHTEMGKSSDWEGSIEPQARYRGFQSNYDFAEAFMLIRQRND